MSALPTRKYRVFFDIWNVFETTLEEDTVDEAIAKVVALYDAEGLNALSHSYDGDDGFRAVEVG